MAKLLLVDESDDAPMADLLRGGGHDVETAPESGEALTRMRERAPEAVVAGVRPPQVDGLAFCRHARAAGWTTPILLVSAHATEADVVSGLSAGADDYVPRSSGRDLILARIAALLRRSALRRPERPGVVHVGALRLDAARLEATWGRQPLTLTVTELRLLELLARHAGIVLSRQRVLLELRGASTIVAPRLVDTYVRRLRRRLEDADPDFSSIETVIGAGYRWRSPDDPRAEEGRPRSIPSHER